MASVDRVMATELSCWVETFHYSSKAVFKDKLWTLLEESGSDTARSWGFTHAVYSGRLSESQTHSHMRRYSISARDERHNMTVEITFQHYPNFVLGAR